jgi:hypothetical protein
MLLLSIDAGVDDANWGEIEASLLGSGNPSEVSRLVDARFP